MYKLDYAYVNGQQIAIGDSLGNGCSREVFECDYKDSRYPNKDFVVKIAHEFSISGLMHNRLEHSVYKSATRKQKELADYLPVFAGISKDGRYLIVEKCVTAYNHYREEPQCQEPECTCPDSAEGMTDEEYDAKVEECEWHRMEWSDPDDYAMQEYDEYIPFCIGDMHCHNWGFTLDGYKPVILDLGCGISDYEELIGDAGISLRCIHYNSSGFLKAA